MKNATYATKVVRTTTATEQGGEPTKIELPIILHPSTSSGKIVIMYLGRNGNIDGFGNRYRTIAEKLQEKIGAVVRASNADHPGIDYIESVQDDLMAIIRWTLANTKSLCGNKKPDIYLMGISAGGGAVAGVAHYFPEVKNILLVAPAKDPKGEVLAGIRKYAGKVYIVGAEEDDVVGRETAHSFFSEAVRASFRDIRIIPHCHHQFSGKNRIVLQEAPFWAFANETPFPNFG